MIILKYIFENKNSCDAVPLMIALDDKIKNSKISVDIGANIGITSIWMAKNSEFVYSFEPEKNNIERFKENININGIKNIELIPKAVSDQIGKLELNILESYGHHSLGKVATSKILGVQIVEVTTLTKFCEDKSIDCIDFLKVDVEGFEIEVFKGAKELFEQNKIKIIAFEISDIPLKSLNKSAIDIFVFLKSFNYKILNIDGSEFKYNNDDKFSHVDLIAVSENIIYE